MIGVCFFTGWGTPLMETVTSTVPLTALDCQEGKAGALQSCASWATSGVS